MPRRSLGVGGLTSPKSVTADLRDLRSATSVNHVLANVTGLIADGRIDPRWAMVVIYICQILLQSISMAQHERWGDDLPPALATNVLSSDSSVRF